MSKLVCFGDSFISFDVARFEDPLFTEILAEKLNISEIKNHGVWGSNLNHSLTHLYKYINSEEYDASDYIIFVIPDSHRLPLVHDNFPPQAAVVCAKNPNTTSFKYLRLSNFSTAWNGYYNPEVQTAHVYALLSTLTLLKNKVIVMNGMDKYDMQGIFPIIADGCLFTLSEKTDAWTDETTKQANHFYPDEHKKLADVIYKYFIDGERFDLEKL